MIEKKRKREGEPKKNMPLAAVGGDWTAVV
jgi:hypothetical protein